MARVLVIEDDTGVREALARGLTRAGHEILPAADGRRGLAEFERAPFDVVVTDINMPEMDGIEVITALRRLGSSVPVIAISGGGLLPKELLLSTASTLGAVEVIPKPFEMSALLEAVDRALDTAAR